MFSGTYIVTKFGGRQNHRTERSLFRGLLVQHMSRICHCSISDSNVELRFNKFVVGLT